MKFEEIINMWEIDMQEGNDIFESLIFKAPQHCYYIDRFPSKIESFEKYKQEELYYQKVIDKKIARDDFEKEEAKFLNIMKKLWLYNSVYFQTNILEVSESSYRSVIKEKDTNINYQSMKSSLLNFKVIEKVDYIDLLMKLSIRECVYSKLLFYEQEILVVAYGMCFQVYFHNLSSLKFVEKVVYTEGLYLRPYIKKNIV